MKRPAILFAMILFLVLPAVHGQDSDSAGAPVLQESPFENFTTLLQNQLSLSASQADINPYPIEKLIADPDHKFGDYKMTSNITDEALLEQMKFFILEMAPSWRETRLDLWKVHLGGPNEDDLLVTYVDGVRKDRSAKKKDPLYKDSYPYLQVWLFKQEGQKYKPRYLGTFLNGVIKGLVPMSYEEKKKKVMLDCLFIQFSGTYYGNGAPRVQAIAFQSQSFFPQVMEFAEDKDNKVFNKFVLCGIGQDTPPCVDYTETRVVMSKDEQAPALIQYYHQFIGDTEVAAGCQGPSQWYVYRNKKGHKYSCEEYLDKLPAQLLTYWQTGKKL